MRRYSQPDTIAHNGIENPAVVQRNPLSCTGSSSYRETDTAKESAEVSSNIADFITTYTLFLALNIVCFHAFKYKPPRSVWIPYFVFMNGHLAVIDFVIISGYLHAFSCMRFHSTSHYSVVEYLKQHTKRLLLRYWQLYSTILVITLGLSSGIEWKNLWKYYLQPITLPINGYGLYPYISWSWWYIRAIFTLELLVIYPLDILAYLVTFRIPRPRFAFVHRCLSLTIFGIAGIVAVIIKELTRSDYHWESYYDWTPWIFPYCIGCVIAYGRSISIYMLMRRRPAFVQKLNAFGASWTRKSKAIKASFTIVTIILAYFTGVFILYSMKKQAESPTIKGSYASHPCFVLPQAAMLVLAIGLGTVYGCNVLNTKTVLKYAIPLRQLIFEIHVLYIKASYAGYLPDFNPLVAGPYWELKRLLCAIAAVALIGLLTFGAMYIFEPVRTLFTKKRILYKEGKLSKVFLVKEIAIFVPAIILIICEVAVVCGLHLKFQ